MAYYNATSKKVYIRGNSPIYMKKRVKSLKGPYSNYFVDNSDSMESVYIHEFAHAMDDQAGRGFSKILFNQNTMEDVRKISTYSTTDFFEDESWRGSEAWAEAYTAYYIGKKDVLSDSMITQLLRLFRRDKYYF